jgi:hypothetical protein
MFLDIYSANLLIIIKAFLLFSSAYQFDFLNCVPKSYTIMPKREDIKKVLIIGSGPIIIGQACEFDYSGTQACKALRSLGNKIVLVNSNPVTIMTDPGIADATYIEPLNEYALTEIIKKERPDALQKAIRSLEIGRYGLGFAKDFNKKPLDEEMLAEYIDGEDCHPDIAGTKTF